MKHQIIIAVFVLGIIYSAVSSPIAQNTANNVPDLATDLTPPKEDAQWFWRTYSDPTPRSNEEQGEQQAQPQNAEATQAQSRSMNVNDQGAGDSNEMDDHPILERVKRNKHPIRYRSLPKRRL